MISKPKTAIETSASQQPDSIGLWALSCFGRRLMLQVVRPDMAWSFTPCPAHSMAWLQYSGIVMPRAVLTDLF